MNNNFKQIIESIKPLDIRAIVGKSGEDATIKDKHLVITVIDTLKGKANKLGYDFCCQNGQPYFYNGNYWQLTTNNDIRQVLLSVAKQIGLNKYTAEYHSFTESLLKQF